MTAAMMLLYCPFPSLETAKVAAKTLLSEHLVACCNILPETHSIYMWEGELTETPEAILIAKTSTQRASAASTRLGAVHPYKCPAILSFSANAAQPFAQWLAACVNHFPHPHKGD